MLFWHQTINGRFFVRAARFRSFHDQGVQNLALKTSFDAQKQSNYAKSRAKYSSEIFSATMRDARFFPAYVKSPASAKTIASPVNETRLAVHRRGGANRSGRSGQGKRHGVMAACSGNGGQWKEPASQFRTKRDSCPQEQPEAPRPESHNGTPLPGRRQRLFPPLKT